MKTPFVYKDHTIERNINGMYHTFIADVGNLVSDDLEMLLEMIDDEEAKNERS